MKKTVRQMWLTEVCMSTWMSNLNAQIPHCLCYKVGQDDANNCSVCNLSFNLFENKWFCEF